MTLDCKFVCIPDLSEAKNNLQKARHAMIQDLRQSPRKVLRTHGSLTLAGTSILSIRTLDVSDTGISISSPLQLKAGQCCTLNFEVFLNGKKQSISVETKIIYCSFDRNEGFKAGLKFININSDSAMILDKYIKN